MNDLQAPEDSPWPFGSDFPDLPALQSEKNVCTEPLIRLLPATRSTEDLHIGTTFPVAANFLEKELDTGRFRQIEHLVWLAGRPIPPRPLHQQILLSRKIVLSESIDLHVVWKRGMFFVKPLPLYLLDRELWRVHIQNEVDDRLAKCARGLIFSYTALVRYQGDFQIAQDTGLLPRAMRWDQWQDIARAFLELYPGNAVYVHVDRRYWYGELRLGRLNKIYRLRPKTLKDFIYGYSNLTAKHLKAEVFSDNLRLIAGSFAYALIVLQAMSVGLATDRLSGSHAFQSVCYGFTVFSIVAPVAAIGGISVVFIFLTATNVVETLVFERNRFASMGRVPPRLYHSNDHRNDVPSEKYG